MINFLSFIEDLYFAKIKSPYSPKSYRTLIGNLALKGHTLKFILELFIELLNTFLSVWSSRMNAFGI